MSRIALFLDFDGTLVHMADRPDRVEVSDDIRRVIDRLIERTGGALAIVSGRPLGEIDRFLAPLVLPGAGSHGVERRDAAGAMLPVADNDALGAATGDLRAYAAEHDLLLEEKRGGSALHFRTAPTLEAEARALADRLAGTSDTLRVIHGHMVAELSFARLDKGSAVAAFMAEAPFAGRLPVAIGDDTTDEDAFRAAQALGGIGIRIGGTDTCARARFADIDAFHDWLTRTATGGTITLETTA